jgi:hypothetical protein
MDCKKDSNKIDCNCTYPCNRKGICCDCISYHRKSGELPACYFPADIEKGYNRSIDNFVKIYKERGICWN